MTSDKAIARTTGVLLLLHLIIGLMLPFIILQPVTATGRFLSTAAENATQVRTAVLLLFVGSAMAIAISATAFRVFTRYSSGLAVALIALAAAAFSLQVVDNGRLLSMLSLSIEYTNSSSPNSEVFPALALVVGSARRWSHYTYLFVAVSWIFLLFLCLYRFRLVPRVLSLLGLLTSFLQIAAVSVRSMLGYAPEMRLAVPLGPVYVAVGLWLVFKGFREPQRLLASEPAASSVATV
jgi:hypothetical protein